jgi:hypothetical protein
VVDIATVKRLASRMPYAVDNSAKGELAFSVGGKGFAWTWKERTAPRKPRTPRIDVLAVRCAAEFKDVILASDPAVFFTEPHYEGFPAVLVRLDKIDEARLRDLFSNAWKCVAPKRLMKGSGSS